MIDFMLILAICATATTCTAQCPYDSFTWVNNGQDNPYFWKSPSFDWNATATLAVFGDITSTPERIEMRDYAHSIGKKVVYATSPDGVIDMNNADERKSWIDGQIAYVKDQKLDGINIDYEGHEPSKTDGFNTVVVELCNAIHEAIPGSQVSVDVGIYPEYEGRNYDYKSIAEACDSLFIMAYDGEFWLNVQCALMPDVDCSNACAPLQAVEHGVQKYIERGVPPKKMFLGLPWYGLSYEFVAGVPIMTHQVRYQDIVNAIDKAKQAGKGSVKMDEASSTMIFDCDGRCSQWMPDVMKDGSSQIWYDDPISLGPKYALATKYGLQGVGMWEATKVDYDPKAKTGVADAMWDSLCQRL